MAAEIQSFLVTSVGAASLLAGLLWLVRNLLLTRLKASVENEFNEKLERLRADLNSKQVEIDAVRASALAGMMGRSSALDRRRLEAVDQLWSAVIALNPMRTVVHTLGAMDVHEISKLHAQRPGLDMFLNAIDSEVDFQMVSNTSGAQARPFVTPMVWAIFSAYHAVCVHGVLTIQALKNRLDLEIFAKSTSVDNVLKAVLPNFSEFVDKYGSKSHQYVIQALEARLLEEIDSMLCGQGEDRKAVQDAAEILRLIDEAWVKKPVSLDAE